MTTATAITHSLNSAELDQLTAEIEAKAEAADARGDYRAGHALRDAIATIENARKLSFFKRVRRREAKA